jgi:lysophospholipid acyltransferase (LPLAT)-like uncharacterized protein
LNASVDCIAAPAPVTENPGAVNPTPEPDPLRNTLYDRKTRSRRKLTRTRLFLYRLAVPIAIGIVRLWWAMLPRTRIVGQERLETALAGHGAIIPVYWHGQQLVPVRHLLRTTHRGLKLGFLISPSVDGELPAMLVKRVGGHVIRGSSSATGARALRDYYEAVVKLGVSPAITPDGPHGPRRRFKPGAILLSQLSGKPIVPMAYAARRAWLFPTWDRFALPWPFSRVALVIGEPVQVPKGLDTSALERWQETLGSQLDALYEQARASL